MIDKCLYPQFPGGIPDLGHSQTLVVKTTGAKERELMVGCRLEDKTIIKAGSHTAKLKALRSSDRVQLTCLRVEDELICKGLEKIKIRKQKRRMTDGIWV